MATFGLSRPEKPRNRWRSGRCRLCLPAPARVDRGVGDEDFVVGTSMTHDCFAVRSPAHAATAPGARPCAGCLSSAARFICGPLRQPAAAAWLCGASTILVLPRSSVFFATSRSFATALRGRRDGVHPARPVGQAVSSQGCATAVGTGGRLRHRSSSSSYFPVPVA
jgi:hypothetical protein